MLKDYLIGDSFQYITVEHAKSGRSSCKTCKQKIGQDQLRIGILVDDDHFSTGQGTQWFHKACFHFKPRHKILEVNQLNKKIHNFQNLNKKEQKDILDYLKEDLAAKKQKIIKKQPVKNADKQTQKSQNKLAQKSKGRHNQKSKGKQTQKSQNKHAQKSKNKTSKVQKKEQVKVVQARGRTRSRGLSLSKVQPLPEVKTVKAKKIVKVKKQISKKFLSANQVKEYKQFLADFNKKSVNQLKQILQKNGQSKTGAKSQLVAKCADGRQFGRIPMCSSCGGGKLRFNRDQGSYNCPGYMEDTDFKNCSKKYIFEQVSRMKWEE